MVFSVYSCVALLFMSHRPTTQKTFGPGPAGFAIPNPAPAGFEKIISGATLHATHMLYKWTAAWLWNTTYQSLFLTADIAQVSPFLLIVWLTEIWH